MARWSLRTKLLAATAIALLPVLILASWRTYDDVKATQSGRADAVAAAAELAVSRHRELIEGSHRMMVAACAADVVRRSVDPAATPADVDACESYLLGLVRKFPADYSAAIVTDADGVARCSSVRTAVGTSFADRDVFKLVRDTMGFSVGAYAASRITPQTIIPIAVPIAVDGRFRGMCALDISLRAFSDLVRSAGSNEATAVILVDRRGTMIGGNAELASSLPVPKRFAAAVAAAEPVFTDYGQDGTLREFHVQPLASGATFAVTALPLSETYGTVLADWGALVLLIFILLLVLMVVWLGTNRWCLRPLASVGEYASRIARGEDAKFAPAQGWTPEMVSVADAVQQMAVAITNRENELNAGLEQRDHMLREIHHRVKNNLQMISSLLNLQAGEIRSPRIRRLFGDAQNRVLTLSILHRHLYERSSWSLVDFQQFISDLVRQVSVSRQAEPRVSPRFHIRAPIMAVGPDTAIPIGLIVTEAIGSAMSHEFSGVTTPEVRIEAMERDGNDGKEVELVIEDNGIDTNRGSLGSRTQGGGFGLTLVHGLAMQLGGRAVVTAREGGGTRVVVRFPMPSEEASDG
jgi:two-component sensor histidine kinase